MLTIDTNQTGDPKLTVPSSSFFVMKVVKIVLLYSDSRMFENTWERLSLAQLGNVVILRVYYVEGLEHNLFSVGQFCDADLEVAFQKNTCFIHNLEGVDLLSGSHDTNLYTFFEDMALNHLRSVFYPKLQRLRPGYGTVDYLISTLDAPSTSIPSSQEQEHSLVISQGMDKSKITRKQSNGQARTRESEEYKDRARKPKT
ncbi:hypothetical protein Tco_1091876 [Tanacetum coccineum]|uniref:Integrase, catalytic region, zinc finger, CCHC-type, peptidase aspartic, catalytic n=1 Tax=Tanacetum coccineum TaxID=301880 RepID=A0ABQ5I8E4_9ASTR